MSIQKIFHWAFPVANHSCWIEIFYALGLEIQGHFIFFLPAKNRQKMFRHSPQIGVATYNSWLSWSFKNAHIWQFAGHFKSSSYLARVNFQRNQWACSNDWKDWLPFCPMQMPLKVRNLYPFRGCFGLQNSIKMCIQSLIIGTPIKQPQVLAPQVSLHRDQLNQPMSFCKPFSR